MRMLAVCVTCAPFLTSFVLLGKNKAKLPVSVEAPQSEFIWSTDGNAPSLTEKDKFKDGSYANYSDEELTPILIQEAMDQWNSIRGSFLQFQLTTRTGELPISQEDRSNHIVVKKNPSASTAAYAAPHGIDDENVIADCDIVINDVKVTVMSFMETMTHELGHCVGLGHPHSNYNAIMSYSRGGNSYRLSSDDKAGAIYLYPDPQYVQGNSKELIGCGTILGRDHNKSSGPWLYWMMCVPLLVSAFMRRRSATSAQSETSK